MIEIVTPADDSALLTIEEARVAAGLASDDDSRDAALTALNDRVAALIARACGVPVAGANPPTLRAETLRETLRLGCGWETIVLARRPILSVTSVVEDGVSLGTDDYERDDAAGMLLRLCDDRVRSWRAGKTVIVYEAGWATVPDDLKLAAVKLLVDLDAAATRDPGLKRERVDGIGEREYWVPPTTDPAIPQEVADMLAPYRQIGLA